ncbi:MAG: hypothetical protein ABSC72_07855 [Methylovirgula sp.]|jgi:hypothetical protein
MGDDWDETRKAAPWIGFPIAFALTVSLVPIWNFMGSRAFAADLLGSEGEAQPVPPSPLVPVRPLPPPLVVAQPRCLIVPQPQSDISGQDVIRFRPTRVCFSRGLLADRLPPPPPPVRPWWRLYW